jgi:hypothetical protein
LLARSREIALPSGATIRTPLLVPSVSSRGFDVDSVGLSEAAYALDVAQDRLTEALLVSSYDLHHRLLPDVDMLLGGDHWSTVYAVPQLLVIDSGGYELGPAWDGNEIYREPRAPRDFTRDDYERVLAGLPRNRDVLVVTYDHVAPGTEHPAYEDQAAQALELLGRHPHLMVDALLKPQFGGGFVDPRAVVPAATVLREVHVVGVTEKELGDSIVDRLVAVARLRRLLDDAGVHAPLHVFGALSFVHVGLYFMAGAEVFDGLDWLRYGHHAGVAVHRETAALLNGLIDDATGMRRGLVTLDYLTALAELKRRLCRWVDTEGDFSVMGQQAGTFEATYAAMIARLVEGD